MSEQYQKTKDAYRRYLSSYKQINNGSLAGAMNFFDFYYYLNYTCRYSDPRSCAPIGYR
jgi:hypothetical protein